jgi:hypothetical protein
MNLTGIISISGKPGLHRVVAQGNNNVIVESLTDKKRFPAHGNNRISALEDISIYTQGEDMPLREVFTAIFKKENGGAAISHKESEAKLVAYMKEVLPEYDQDRVYLSDIRKLFQWYNLLQQAGLLALEEEKAEEPAEATEKKKAAPKKPAAEKKVPAAKASPKSAAPKAAAAGKKAPTKKPSTPRKAG